jgi:hypothetical protein
MSRTRDKPFTIQMLNGVPVWICAAGESTVRLREAKVNMAGAPFRRLASPITGPPPARPPPPVETPAPPPAPALPPPPVPPPIELEPDMFSTVFDEGENLLDEDPSDLWSH